MVKYAFSVHAKEWIAPSKLPSAIVQKCGSKNCLCCKTIDTNNRFISFSTGGHFIFDFDECTKPFTCKSKYVIYLITCIKCGFQYVGQTTQELHCRLNGHRSAVNNKNKNTYLYEHFRSDGHTFHDVRIQIIDHVKFQDVSELEAKKQLDIKEDFYIKTVNTLYPLGLNDKVIGGGCISQNSASADCFYSSPIPRRKRSRGCGHTSKRRPMRSSECVREMFSELSTLFEEKKLAKFYRKLRSLYRKILRSMLAMLSDRDDNVTFVITAFILNTFSIVNRSTVEREYITIPFNCKKVDELNMLSIVCDKNVNSLLPENIRELYPPKIFYKLANPISLRLCNYNKFLKNLNIEEIQKVASSTCVCSEYPSYVYEPYGHVLTGNVNIIANEKLRRLFKFGTKFRLPKDTSWNEIEKQVKESFELHIKQVCRRRKLDSKGLKNWKNKIFNILHNRVYHLKRSKTRDDTFSFNFDHTIKKSIEGLHNDFIIGSVDKAAGNFSFVCKKFYVEALMKELGMDFSDSLRAAGNITYKPVDEATGNIVARHVSEIKHSFDVVCPESDKKLPRIFWIPKFHKNPFKFRFIAGARHCTTKKLSVLINKGLRCVREKFQSYCSTIYKNSGYNCFWSIKNTQEFLDRFVHRKVHSLQTFDFSTLYTNLDQGMILSHLIDVVDLTFNSSSRKFICMRWDKCFFSSRKYKGYHCFDHVEFKKAICYILSEVYVSFGGLVFQQTRGIPMGGNSSPLLADLFLAHCEYKYMKDLMKSKTFNLARMLSNNTRYIDDVCVFNYTEFESLIPLIYPADLVADRCGDDNNDVVYLDSRVLVSSEGIRCKVYHKVDDFNFNVVLLTFPESMIPLSMGYNIFAGQVIRYLRICSHITDAIERINKTIQLLKERGYRSRRLKYTCEKLLTRHDEVLNKFGFFAARQLTSLCEF